MLLASWAALVVACGGGTPEAPPPNESEKPPADPVKPKLSKPAPSITKAKYRKIQNGMTYDEVFSIIGEHGEELSSNQIAGIHTVMLMWKNPDGSNMNATFQNGKLVQKAQFGLPEGVEEPPKTKPSSEKTQSVTKPKPNPQKLSPEELAQKEAERKALEAEAKKKAAIELEKKAAAKLRLAEQLIKKGKTSTGQSWLEEIAKEYPGTKAAETAQQKLDAMK